MWIQQKFGLIRRDRTFLLSIIAAVGLLTVVVCRHFSIGEDDITREYFWFYKTHLAQGYDTILMGDSRVYRDLSPQAMEHVLPDRKILNFGYSSGGINQEMLEAAEEKLKEDATQKMLVLGIDGHTLSVDSADNAHYLSILKKPWDEYYVTMYLRRVRRLFRPIEIYPVDILDKANASMFKEVHYKNGYVATTRLPLQPEQYYESYGSEVIDGKRSVAPKILQQVLNLIRECRKRNIIVFAFRPPQPENWWRLEEEYGGFDAAAIRTAVEEAGAVWIPVVAGEWMTYDGSHLSAVEAERFSSYLAEYMKVYLGKAQGEAMERTEADSVTGSN